MRNKLFPLIAVVFLLAASASCVKPDPYDAGKYTPSGKEEEKEKEKGDDVKPAQEKLSTAFLSAKETVAAMGAGWNLGNTLDAHSGDTTNMWIEGWGPSGISDYEKAWGQFPPTKELFQMMHDAGFRAIRIPVTWYPHMGTQFHTEVVNDKPLWKPSLNPIGYTVDAAWMAEVKRVVDAVLAADMYCIVNVHHDTGTSNTHWVVADKASYAANSERFKSLWTQIATTFKDYDGRLLFEGYNEMTDSADSWCFASFNTPAQYDAAIATSAYSAVNSYAQDFVDAVRATGGNNAERNLIVNTYAAASGDGNWNQHLLDPLKEMKVPADKVKDHIILQVHYYPTFTAFSNNEKNSVKTFFSNLKTYLASKGAPVIIGEWGVGDGSGITYDVGRADFLAFAEYFVAQAKANGMATFYWMGITDKSDRTDPKFTQPYLKDAIIKGIQ